MGQTEYLQRTDIVSVWTSRTKNISDFVAGDDVSYHPACQYNHDDNCSPTKIRPNYGVSRRKDTGFWRYAKEDWSREVLEITKWVLRREFLIWESNESGLCCVRDKNGWSHGVFTASAPDISEKTPY